MWATSDPGRVYGVTAALAQPGLRLLTVLVVDDDALVLLNTATMLEDLGHTVPIEEVQSCGFSHYRPGDAGHVGGAACCRHSG
jgi:hypothetical protein